MKDSTLKINSYLTFKLADEIFGANVSKVLNILEMTKITKVPKAPNYMKGVINLRGAVLPLIDTRIKFDMGETAYTTNTCILVLDIEMGGDSVHVGALVDSVQEVIEIDEASIQPPPSIGSKYKSEFIEGMAKINDEFIMLLNMDLIFSTDELSMLRDSSTDVLAEPETVVEKKGIKK
jgi:purine-binding chemotaxis protein CheW